MTDRIYDIEWKPTTYKGILYRSKLESEWAELFDNLNVIYTYEQKSFHLEHLNCRYTPDFALMLCPYQYIEIKPTRPTQLEFNKCVLLSLKGFKVALIAGQPHSFLLYLFQNGNGKMWWPRWWQYLLWLRNYQILETREKLKILVDNRKELNSLRRHIHFW